MSLAVTAFFDITGNNGRLYVFEDGALREGIPFELSEDQRFFTGELPEDIGEVLVSLPLEMLDFRMLELPISEPARVREVLPFELDGLILGGAEGVVVDALVLKEPRGEKHRVLAVFVEREKIRALLGRLSELGLDPRAITSLELAHAVKISSGTEELGSMLLEPSTLAESERPAAALAELSDLTINLRRGEFAYTRDIEKTRRSLMLTALALVLLLLLFAGDLGLRTLKLGKQTAVLESEIVSLYSGMFPGEKPKSARGLAYKAKALLKEARGKEAQLKGLYPLEFLMSLQEARPPEVVFTDITLDREFVSLKGEARTLSDVQKAKAALEGFLSEVKISETGQSVKEKVSFTISAREKAD